MELEQLAVAVHSAGFPPKQQQPQQQQKEEN